MHSTIRWIRFLMPLDIVAFFENQMRKIREKERGKKNKRLKQARPALNLKNERDHKMCSNSYRFKWHNILRSSIEMNKCSILRKSEWRRSKDLNDAVESPGENGFSTMHFINVTAVEQRETNAFMQPLTTNAKD